MNTDEIMAAIGGPTAVPHQPEGGSAEVTPLTGHHLSRPITEAAPENVNALQGAGSGNSLTPGAQGVASDGAYHVGWKGGAYSQAGPALLPALPGLAGLTPTFGGSRPSDSSAVQAPASVPAPLSGPVRTISQGLNPALGRMPKTPPGTVR